MRRLITADIRRILCKKEIYVFAFLLYAVLLAVKSKSDVEDQIDLFQTMVTLLAIFFCIIPVFLTVYGDEIRTGAMQCVIGRGMSRRKVIISKLADCCILFVLMFLGFLCVFYFKNYMSDLVLSPKQNLMALIYVLITCVRATGYFAISGMLLFTSWNVAIGLTSNIMLVSVVVALTLIQDNTHISLADFWLDGLLSASYNDILIGNFPWKLILAVAVYIVGVVFLTGIIFDRKELDL